MTDLHVQPIARAVRKANRRDVHDVAAVIGEAFTPLAPSAWLVPDDLWDRQGMLSSHAWLWVEHALTHGHVDVLDHAGIEQRAPVAVAVWFHGHEHPAPLQDGYALRLAQTCVEHAPQFHDLDAVMEARHPELPPHHYLAFVATHPSAQGHGLGSRLVRAHHARLDRLGLPSFTEARDQRSRDWLAHYGYRPTASYRLPGSGPRLWAMWRDRVR